MTDDRFADLAALTLDAARAMVGQDFHRSHEGGSDIPLRLIAAEPTELDPSAQPTPDGRPFTLFFKGPANPQLTQGMHDLNHPRHPFFNIFLVPVGQDEDSATYEAIFS